MFFGKRSRRQEKELPAAFKRQILLQVILLLAVLGILILLLQRVNRSETALRRSVPPPPEGPVEEPPMPEGLEEALGGPIEVQEPVEPEPFEERRQVLSEAAVREAMGELDTEALVYLFQRVRTRREELETGEPVLSTRRGDAVWDELVEGPNRYRGDLVEVRGNLVARSPAASPVELDREVRVPWPNAAGVPAAYRAYLYEGRRFFAVSLWHKEREFSHMDAVGFRGYFLGLYAYDHELDGEKVRAKIPLLVGDGFEPLPPALDRRTSLRVLYILAIVLPLVALAVIAAVSWSSNRRSAERSRKRAGQRRLDEGSEPR